MAKPWKIPYLKPDRSLDICLPKILNHRFNEMLSYEKGMIEGNDIEYLHNMRISSRRVQAILKAFRGSYPQKKYKKEYVKIQTLIRALGFVRHYDVFIDLLEKYSESVDENNRNSIELLIIRQKSMRTQKRRELLNTIKVLNRGKFKENFQKFISLT
jgi:CHAD domain-containing protein